jgi:hypothetical protein
MIENNDDLEIIAFPYNGHNGIIICCVNCGSEFEETCNGYYHPLNFEHERHDRKCPICIMNE